MTLLHHLPEAFWKMWKQGGTSYKLSKLENQLDEVKRENESLKGGPDEYKVSLKNQDKAGRRGPEYPSSCEKFKKDETGVQGTTCWERFCTNFGSKVIGNTFAVR